jgi:urease accessory protein
MADHWLIWQIVDSAFPTGGFAHSWGLEAAWQAGEVGDEDALARFLRETLWQTGRATMPLLTAAHGDPSRVREIDARADAFLINPIANRASRVQGRAWLSTCARVWPLDTLRALDSEARANLHGHHAPLAGATLRALDVPARASQQLYLYTAARGVLSAAVRLGIVGTYRAQQLQRDASPDLDAVIDCCGDLMEDDIAQTAPILDLLQLAHDRLYSRLFQS